MGFGRQPEASWWRKVTGLGTSRLVSDGVADGFQSLNGCDRIGKQCRILVYIIPFAIATVIGGIDCAESAASVGDDFETSQVIGIEAIATILAACVGA